MTKIIAITQTDGTHIRTGIQFLHIDIGLASWRFSIYDKGSFDFTSKKYAKQWLKEHKEEFVLKEINLECIHII